MCAPIEPTCGAEGDVHGVEPTCGYIEPRGGRSRAGRVGLVYTRAKVVRVGPSP
jgi:hypothetical protein